MKIVTSYRQSNDYGPDYIEKLSDGLAPHKLEVIEETRWPGWWCKMGLFDPKIEGDLLHFDLDTVITGPLDDILDVDFLTMLSDFHVPNRLASGMMFIPKYVRAEIWDTWIEKPDEHMRQFRGFGDGGFLAQFWEGRSARWQDVLPGQIVSYKVHCKQGKPPDARVVCFHGSPRPRSVGWKV